MVARTEHDLLGERQVPRDALWGIHTLRAIENFPISGRHVNPALIHAYGLVKLACARANRAIGVWSASPGKADAIERACRELADGKLDEHIRIDALAGGAGTSLNMNVNEVIAGRATQLMGPAATHFWPTDDVNRHQSTNDTYPTAAKLAAMALLERLGKSIALLHEALREKERQFAHVVKVGRTQLQDAVLTTLGLEFSAYAQAVSRDRCRIHRCNDRLRVTNLGGTAIGTGLAAPREFVLRVTEDLRAVSGRNVVRADNLIDATQNADVFVEVSGVLKAHAASLIKICSDLRFMASGPENGLAEIRLPAVQAGSSIMPGKVNPVIPEAVTQVAMRVIGNDVIITQAASSGSLELNPFLPIIADCLLESADLLSAADRLLAARCITGIEANEEKCRSAVRASTAVATALVPVLGYERVCDLVKKAKETNLTVREAVLQSGLVTPEQFEQFTSPEAVCRLGTKI